MDEADLKEVKAEVRYHMRCAFFGTDCEEVQMVPVPVHAGYEEDTMACDLYHRFYVNTLNPCHNRVIRFEDFTIDVGSWPRESNKSSKYVVFYGNGVSYNLFNDWGGTNYLIRGLKGGRELKIKGHVLVAKTDQNGVVKRSNVRTWELFPKWFSGSASLTWYPEFWADTVETRATLRPPPRYAAADHHRGLISPTHLRSFRPYTTREEAHLAGLHHSRVIPSRHLAAGLARSHADCQGIQAWAACVRVQISDRIRYLLDRWIPAIHMQDFLNALNRSGDGCGWWYEMAMKRGELHTMDWSYDLNIVAPAGRAGRVQGVFPEYRIRHLALRGKSHATIMASLLAWSAVTCVEKTEQSNEVTITEATEAVVPVVVASPTTCQLNMFSSTTLFTFVPLFITKYMGNAD
ncbi:hypothetical protein BKA70DRAFT_1243712 [Coprinopsis sp. MPI-PUGE-AT-0042]|nr:hypothetical protein BKA70DRAFT_1243712 [Coprinopsis sp. MPI-PUGE-AT-0042]